MRRSFTLHSFTALLCFVILCTQKISAQAVVTASRILDSGIYNVSMGSDSLIRQTDTIPMKMGTSFGFRFKVIADPDNRSIPLTMKIQITDKAGKVTDIQYEMKYLPHDFSTGRHSFQFEAPEELIAGTWKFSIEYNGAVLLEKSLIIE